MTLQTTIKSGNIPLKMLGSETNNQGYHAAYPCYQLELGLGVPLIRTTELSTIMTQKEAALSLPLPLLNKSEVPQRSLSVAWRFPSWLTAGNAVIMVPSFQVRILNVPWRPPGWDCQFISTGTASSKLSNEVFAWNDDHDNKIHVTTITNIDGAASVGPNSEDMQCYLKVRLPCKKQGTVLGLRWEILGIAVDQW